MENKFELGEQVKIKSTGEIAKIISIDIQFGSQILTLSNNKQIVWNGSFRNWDESQVEKINYKTSELYESINKEKNEDLHGIKSGYQCICCMKPIKNKSNVKFVHMTTDWEMINLKNEEEFPSNKESQGFFEVGPYCSKKIDSEFLFEL